MVSPGAMPLLILTSSTAMQDKRVSFRNRWPAYVFIAPQLVVILIFFFWPAFQAIKQSVYLEDPFGLESQFVWLDNFRTLFQDPLYYESFKVTMVFSLATIVLSLTTALLLAVLADHAIKGAKTYKTFTILPYAVAPPLAGILWLFIFHPTGGIIAYLLQGTGIVWDYHVNGAQAMMLVVIAAAWKQISYNFHFFLAGLQAIPKSLMESAAIDGAGPITRFFTVVFPLLSPTTFFLLVVNVIYAFFETFGIIHAVTQGGPGTATATLIFKVFNDGFIGLDLGGSAAQSVILMAIVMVLTIVQFRFIERRVQY